MVWEVGSKQAAERASVLAQQSIENEENELEILSNTSSPFSFISTPAPSTHDFNRCDNHEVYRKQYVRSCRHHCNVLGYVTNSSWLTSQTPDNSKFGVKIDTSVY